MRAINQLWRQFQQAIDAADADGRGFSADGHAEVNALHDYTTERGWRLANLVGRESANERQHRKTSTAPVSFTVAAAARVHIMNNAAWGATRDMQLPAHCFLTMRQTAAEAVVIGFLVRKELTEEWIAAVGKLDYSELMQVSA